jgi:hypothetical protein
MSEPVGWLVNDCLTCIPGTETLWHNLLKWLPGLKDMTNGYTPYPYLATIIEMQPNRPDYIIRNGSYFRKLNIDVPTFCLIQDTQNSVMQTEVINACTGVVFPSKFTYNMYKDRITQKNVHIIQNGADFDFFKPISARHPDVLPNSILFIGDSSIEKKGFHRVLWLMDQMPEFNFCLVMKDDSNMSIIPHRHRDRVRIFNKIPMEVVRLVINSCVIAICTSGNEEEHIAGVECGACDIPMVARPLSRYQDDRDDIEWGLVAEDEEFPEKIRFVVNNRHLFKPREYYYPKYSTDVSRQKWTKMVKTGLLPPADTH